MSRYKNLIVLFILILILTGCDKKEKYAINDNVSLTGTIVNKEDKTYLNLEEPIIIDGSEVKQIEIDSDSNFKENKSITIDGKLSNKNNELALEIDEIDDPSIYINTYSNEDFKMTIPTSIIKYVTVKNSEDGFIIYSTSNMNIGGKVIEIKSVTSSEYKTLQKNKNIIVERITSNQEKTIVALIPTSQEYDEENAKEYETICEQISTIKKSVKIK